MLKLRKHSNKTKVQELIKQLREHVFKMRSQVLINIISMNPSKSVQKHSLQDHILAERTPADTEITVQVSNHSVSHSRRLYTVIHSDTMSLFQEHHFLFFRRKDCPSPENASNCLSPLSSALPLATGREFLMKDIVPRL